jgi:aminopeptidase N
VSSSSWKRSTTTCPSKLTFIPSLLERAREYFKGTAELVRLYSDGSTASSIPWPGKYAQVFVQDFIFGGMENTTITVMTDRILGDVGTREEQRLAGSALERA